MYLKKKKKRQTYSAQPTSGVRDMFRVKEKLDMSGTDHFRHNRHVQMMEKKKLNTSSTAHSHLCSNLFYIHLYSVQMS